MAEAYARDREPQRAPDATQFNERRRTLRGPLAVGRFDESRLISMVVFTGVVRLIEFLLVFGTGLAVSLIYVPDYDTSDLLRYATAVFAAAGVTLVVFQVFDLYGSHTFASLFRQLARIGVAWTMVFAVLVALAFFAKMGHQFSRIWLVAWYVTGLGTLVVFRAGLTQLVKSWSKSGRLNRRAVIVGGGPAGEALIKALEASPDTDIRICGIFDDRGDDRVSPNVAGYPKLGNISELLDFARKTRIDLLIVSLPLAAESRLLQLLKKLWVLPVDIRLSAHTNKLRFRPRSYSYIGNVPFLDVFDKPITDWDYVTKWLFDKIAGAMALILLAPLMALIAIAIKLESRGPAFFKQKRYGFNNELIEVYKFRSMYADKTDAHASKLVTKDDPRVTRVGRFIRKTSLDELPQLINVLKGELSMVGPRPHALQAKAASALYDDVVDGYFARHRVKPGITGWAQINGWRGETDTPEKIQRRVEHDLYYIENWSVLFDLYILLMTPLALLKTQNAY
jgi:Undecaprenyl-phosphate glucose phosphotransferase